MKAGDNCSLLDYRGMAEVSRITRGLAVLIPGRKERNLLGLREWRVDVSSDGLLGKGEKGRNCVTDIKNMISSLDVISHYVNL